MSPPNKKRRHRLQVHRLSAMPVALDSLDESVKTLLVKAEGLVASKDFSDLNAGLEKADAAREATFPFIGDGADRIAEHVGAYCAATYYVACCYCLMEKKEEMERAVDLLLLRGGASDWGTVVEGLLTAERNGDAFKPDPKRKKEHRDVPRPAQFIEADWAKQIPRVDAAEMSLTVFRDMYMMASPPKPVIITNVVSKWPAFDLWKDLSYLASVAKGRLVPVETYRKEDASKSYLSDSWAHEVMSLDQYIEQYMRPREVLAKEGTAQASLQAYLAQHPLFDQIPALRNDIQIPLYCSARTEDDDNAPEDCEFKHAPFISAWFGPAGTVSPLHTDPYHNVLAQVVGSKYIRIYDAHLSKRIYGTKSDRLGQHSSIDIDDVRMNDESYVRSNFPQFLETPCWQTILKEGELLYIPRHAWHYVRSLETSFSASFWFGAKMELVEGDGDFKTEYVKKHVPGRALNLQ